MKTYPCPKCGADVVRFAHHPMCMRCGELLALAEDGSLRPATAAETARARREIDILETVQTLICLRRELLTGGHRR